MALLAGTHVVVAGTRFDFAYLQRLHSAIGRAERRLQIRVWSSFRWHAAKAVSDKLAAVLCCPDKKLLASFAYLLQGRSRFWVSCIFSAFEDGLSIEELYLTVTQNTVEDLRKELAYLVQTKPDCIRDLVEHYLSLLPADEHELLTVPTPPVLTHGGVFFYPKKGTDMTILTAADFQDEGWLKKIEVHHCPFFLSRLCRGKDSQIIQSNLCFISRFRTLCSTIRIGSSRE
jgi:hypothetical protein